jgi:hypothetical protein
MYNTHSKRFKRGAIEICCARERHFSRFEFPGHQESQQHGTGSTRRYLTSCCSSSQPQYIYSTRFRYNGFEYSLTERSYSGF